MAPMIDGLSRPASAAALVGTFDRSRLSRISRAGLRLSDHKLILTAGDLYIAMLSVAGALLLWAVRDEGSVSALFLRQHAYWFAAVLPWMLLLTPTYHVSVVFSAKDTTKAVAKAAAIGLALYPLVYFMAPRELLPRLVVLYFFLIAGLLTIGWHLAYIRTFTRAANRRRVAIIGTGSAAQIIQVVLKRVARDMMVVAFVHIEDDEPPKTVDRLPVWAGADGLHELVEQHNVSEIVLATDTPIEGSVLRALVKCQEMGTDVVRMSTAYERLLQRIPINHLESDWVFTTLVDSMRLQDASRLAKRTVDVIGGLLGSLAFLVLLPLVGSLIWATAGRPILFKQLRIGRNDKPFQLIKFRTMTEDAERHGPQWTRADDRRVTAVGRFLRRTRLDEFPQFINVLQGHMSLVGPRPERPEFVSELEQTIPFYRTRLMVRPGLTGWAQVNYRYGDSVTDSAVKLEYDLYYIKHRSFVFDFLIALRTIKTIVTFSGR
jgi:exopolysaccharide biosynthesis polyprenyl glycosylphosphotransferase